MIMGSLLALLAFLLAITMGMASDRTQLNQPTPQYSSRIDKPAVKLSSHAIRP